MKIDLHIHSQNSDGADLVEDLIPLIQASPVDVFALTDHDRTDGWALASELSQDLNLSFIPGVEITTEGRLIGAEGQPNQVGIHLLAYLPDASNEDLVKVLEDNQRSRELRIREFVANLKVDYPALTIELVLELAKDGSTLGRPDLAAALVHLREFKSVGEVFGVTNSPIQRGHRAYVPNKAPDVLDVIKIVRAAGGVPVLAHPLARKGTPGSEPNPFPREHFEAMVEAGLLGLETKHSEVSPDTREILESFAAEFSLVTTGSSDYHGLSVKKDNPLGLHTTSREMLNRILELGTGTKPTLSSNF
jgi:predicted metal-dependent phosphoesterase TrpH